MNFFLIAASLITLLLVVFPPDWQPRTGQGLYGVSAPWSDVPARLDRLPWSRFHTGVCLTLSLIWIASGLVVMLVSSLDRAIRDRFGISIGLSASAYLAAAVTGAVLSGWATDRLGRRRLIIFALGVYALGTFATGLAGSPSSFISSRIVTGIGIGGQYVAVNAVVQELIPARRRGVAVIIVNSTFWVGAAIGALPALYPAMAVSDIGWRWAFVAGSIAASVLALVIAVFDDAWIDKVGFGLPESPRWLISQGHSKKAEEIVERIEKSCLMSHGQSKEAKKIFNRTRGNAGPHSKTENGGQSGYVRLLNVRTYHQVWGVIRSTPQGRERAILGFVLMGSQAFLYNGVAFNYDLLLQKSFRIPVYQIGQFTFLFALGNLVGPIVLGWLFDSVRVKRSRTKMNTITYALSGILIAIVGLLFWKAEIIGLDSRVLAACWMLTFFFASVAASAAYLTVGEAFPSGMRAKSIPLFFALGTAVGGMAAPWLFEKLVWTETRTGILGYCLAASALMIAAAVIAWCLGFEAENKSVE